MAGTADDARRKVPSVDSLLRSEPGRRASGVLGRPLLKHTLAAVLEEVRRAARDGDTPPPDDEILAMAASRASAVSKGLTPVINATGVVLHTNLGRAPLATTAVQAVSRAAQTYADLEIDRSTGNRGKRSGRAETTLAAITGAEDALVVNNCAAALLLTLAAVAKGKQVLVSRGELVEIGGEFRIPEVVASSGAKMVEVGTTNRTRISDYRAGLSERTGAILKVHTSNYRVVGFTAETSARQLAGLASKSGIPFVYDVGSGLLDRERGFPGDEPTVQDALEQGADLVTFSGDKLLGGPQAGCVVGRADLVARLRKHPIARAVRVDKLQLAALEATLALYATGKHLEIPVHRMLHEPQDSLSSRAHRISEEIGGDLEGAHVVKSESVAGGGSFPGLTLPSWAVRVRVPDPPAFAARLRTGSPAVLCRVAEDHVLLDARTVMDEQIPHLARAVLYALEGDDFEED